VLLLFGDVHAFAVAAEDGDSAAAAAAAATGLPARHVRAPDQRRNAAWLVAPSIDLRGHRRVSEAADPYRRCLEWDSRRLDNRATLDACYSNGRWLRDAAAAAVAAARVEVRDT
jgi:hypothetical protein